MDLRVNHMAPIPQGLLAETLGRLRQAPEHGCLEPCTTQIPLSPVCTTCHHSQTQVAMPRVDCCQV